MNQKKIERQSLIVSTLGNLVIGLAGVAIYIVTNLNALLLDGAFSFIAFLSSLAAFFISKNSHRQTETFPQGLFFLEPLYAIMKSLAILVLLIMTTLETSANAYAYFADGTGSAIVTGPILPYTIIMVALCFSLGAFNSHKNRQINNMSTIIAAEAKGNFIDGLISAGVGIAILILNFIDIKSSLGFLHYTGDFFITILLVIFSIKEPLSVLSAAFKEFAYAPTQDSDIKENIYNILQPHIDGDRDDLDIQIFKQGMRITVKIYIVSLEDPDLVEDLAESKAQLLNQLRKKYDHIHVEYSF